MVSATAIIPSILPSFIKYIGVFPCAASSFPFLNTSKRLSLSPYCSFTACSFPAMILESPTNATIPLPDIASNSFGETIFNLFSLAFSTIASAKGCSEALSTPAANAKNSFSSISNPKISVTTGLPSVTVPVLSSTTVSML